MKCFRKSVRFSTRQLQSLRTVSRSGSDVGQSVSQVSQSVNQSVSQHSQPDQSVSQSAQSVSTISQHTQSPHIQTTSCANASTFSACGSPMSTLRLISWPTPSNLPRAAGQPRRGVGGNGRKAYHFDVNTRPNGRRDVENATVFLDTTVAYSIVFE